MHEVGGTNITLFLPVEFPSGFHPFREGHKMPAMLLRKHDPSPSGCLPAADVEPHTRGLRPSAARRQHEAYHEWFHEPPRQLSFLEQGQFRVQPGWHLLALPYVSEFIAIANPEDYDRLLDEACGSRHFFS